jgi:DNA-binding transcriptional MerR regulator
MSYSIQETAKKVNMTIYTLRYYENAGILPAVERDVHGNRLFSDDNIEWINLIRCLRKTGMTISMIKHYVDLYLEGDETLQGRKQIMVEQKQKIEQKLVEFNQYLKLVSGKIEHYNLLLNENSSTTNLSNTQAAACMPKRAI